MSANVYAEQWLDGICVRSAPVSLTQDVEEIRILMKERRSDGKVIGIDIQIDTDEYGGSLLTYFAFPKEAFTIGWAFTAYEEGDTLKVIPGEEKILAAMAFDEGNGGRAFDPETLIMEPERLEQTDHMIVIRAEFSAEVLGMEMIDSFEENDRK